MLKIGCHVGNNGDLMLLGSSMEAASYGASCYMVYMGPPQSTFRKPAYALRGEEAIKYANEHGIATEDIIVHAPYIVNLGQPDDEKFMYAVRFLSDEFNNVGKVGFKYIVLHPGAHVGSGSDAGIKRIASGINLVMQNTVFSKTVILIETMSGKGTECGITFNQVADIISLIEDKSRIGVCLDTCHIHDAGYDIVNHYEDVIQEFDDVIGLKYLKAIHVNDSKNPCGAHKDRHENIGFGYIGFDTLMKFVYDERFKDIPKILETPYIPDPVVEKLTYSPYKQEIEMIRNRCFDEKLKHRVIVEKM